MNLSNEGINDLKRGIEKDQRSLRDKETEHRRLKEREEEDKRRYEKSAEARKKVEDEMEHLKAGINSTESELRTMAEKLAREHN